MAAALPDAPAQLKQPCKGGTLSRLQWIAKHHEPVVVFLVTEWVLGQALDPACLRPLMNLRLNAAWPSELTANFLARLRPEQRTPVDRYLPWLAREFDRTYSQMALSHEDPLHDLWPLRVFFASRATLSDWLVGARPDINRYGIEEALGAALEWHSVLEQAREAQEEAFRLPDPEWPVYAWPDGWKVARVNTAPLLARIGRALKHCYGTPSVARSYLSTAVMYVLLDPEGAPHVTLEQQDMNESAALRQVRGKANSIPAPKYHDRLREFIRKERCLPYDAWGEATALLTDMEFWQATVDINSWVRMKRFLPYMRFHLGYVQLREGFGQLLGGLVPIVSLHSDDWKPSTLRILIHIAGSPTISLPLKHPDEERFYTPEEMLAELEHHAQGFGVRFHQKGPAGDPGEVHSLLPPS